MPGDDDGKGDYGKETTMIRRIKNVSVLVFLLAVLTGSANQAEGRVCQLVEKCSASHPA